MLFSDKNDRKAFTGKFYLKILSTESLKEFKNFFIDLSHHFFFFFEIQYFSWSLVNEFGIGR